MKVAILDRPFDPWTELAKHQDEVGPLRAGAYGATAVFVGTMRDVNEHSQVYSMTLEHYPGMTERHLQRISEGAARKWDILDSLIIHRVGELRPDDPIVLVAVWSAHRAAAFAACRYLIEDLKSHAPFWKKEQTDKGGRWVEMNTPA